ncbi:hypothetical protein CPB86DRAFT_743617 [Serendipita vermifera]|nr:hypothetical protein CPB86DRAFT_743617 [Serendipita vermifera]
MRDIEELERKKSSYNHLLDELCDLKFGKRVDPMKVLPGEIVTNILLDLSRDETEGHVVKNSDMLLSPMMVSRKWRQFIVSEPILWNYIRLVGRKSTSFNLRLHLYRSTGLTITIRLDLLSTNWKSIYPDLLINRDRISEIAFNGNMFRDGEDRDGLRQILKDLGPLTNLRRLRHISEHRDGCYRQNIPCILDYCPTLDEISGFEFSSEDLKMVKGQWSIPELLTRDGLASIVSIAKRIRSIRQITFMPPLSLEPDIMFQSLEQRNEIEWTPLTDGLEWTHLTYLQQGSPAFISLLHSLRGLLHLDITSDLSTVKDTISMIHHLPQLVTFKAFIDLARGDFLLPTDDLHPNFQVQALDLTISNRDFYEHLGDSPEQNQLVQDANQTIKAILQVFPNVSSLTLSLPNIPALSFDLLQETYTGDEMYLDVRYYHVTAITETKVPSSIKKLILCCPVDLVPALSSSSVMHLDILWSETDHYEDSPPVLEERMGLDSWPSLDTLTIAKHCVRWNGHYHSSLRRIVLLRARGSPQSFDEVTAFIRDLAQRTESYPFLEEIELGDWPEWDILIIMLERRNLLANHNIKPLMKLRLPSPLPSNIHRILKELMQCKWTERPSNKELSLAGNVETILNPDIPGCYKCHRILRECSVETAEWNWGVGFESPVPESMKEYPDKDEEVLESWDERSKLWENVYDSLQWREQACADHERVQGQFISVDSYV